MEAFWILLTAFCAYITVAALFIWLAAQWPREGKVRRRGRISVT